MKLLYVVSASYSGSTLLAFMLGRHPQIATVGELSGPDSKIPPDEQRCSCGEWLKQCPFWQRIEQIVTNRGIDFDILRQDKHFRISRSKLWHHLLTRPLPIGNFEIIRNWLFHLPRLKFRLQHFLSTNVNVMQAICEEQHAEVFLDTSKDIDRLQLLLFSRELQISVIHLVRDGRGQTYSKIRRGTPMQQAARWLVQFDGLAGRLATKLGTGHFMRLRYEDLCQYPLPELDRIADFIGIKPFSASTDIDAPQPVLHILGNPMKWRGTSTIEIDNRWQQALTPHELQLFERIAGRRNRQFGYERTQLPESIAVSV
ncbi:MAG: sulfotransferase [candidate division KSB1 bacterium]|nr:sulfotransferase [candidate division KSB1 bacterium]